MNRQTIHDDPKATHDKEQRYIADAGTKFMAQLEAEMMAMEPAQREAFLNGTGAELLEPGYISMYHKNGDKVYRCPLFILHSEVE